jgi:hypothetical protein
MTILLGVDEAGYGPNLGPLTIALTGWRLETPATAETSTAIPDLYALLSDGVARRPAPGKVAVADSKTLYPHAAGLRHLERGVLASLAIASGEATLAAPWPGDWAQLVERLGADPAGQAEHLPWHQTAPLELPCATAAEDVSSAIRQLSDCCRAVGVALVATQARLVFPAELNALVDEWGTKGAALSHVTLGLVQRVVASADGSSATGSRRASKPNLRIVCDKHGGRNRYAALLQHYFSDYSIAIREESRAVSRYRCDGPLARLDVEFRAGGEAFLPAALASMTAKYLRELAMRAFNEFWQRHLPELRSTAGYPVDARRFRSEIAACQQSLGIADRLLWRAR